MTKDPVDGSRRRFAVAAASAPFIPSLAQAAGGSAPFEIDDARVYVQASLASGTSGGFVLDSGIEPTFVDKTFALASGLQVTGEREVGGVGAGATLVGQTSPISLAVAGRPTRIKTPAVADLARLLGPSSGRAPAGIIGSAFFFQHAVGVDFSGSMLSVNPPADPPRLPGATRVPVTFHSGAPVVQMDLITPKGRRVRLALLADLGAKSTCLLAETAARRLGLAGDFADAQVRILGAGFGGETRFAFARAASLEIAGHRDLSVAQPVIGMSAAGTLKEGFLDGLLGLDFLSRFDLVFAHARREMLWKSRGLPAIEFDASGLTLFAEGPELRRYRVREVAAGSPAADAQVMQGDAIDSIDGRPASQLSLSAIRDRLRFGSAPNVTLAVTRGGATTELRIELRRLV